MQAVNTNHVRRGLDRSNHTVKNHDKSLHYYRQSRYRSVGSFKKTVIIEKQCVRSNASQLICHTVSRCLDQVGASLTLRHNPATRKGLGFFNLFLYIILYIIIFIYYILLYSRSHEHIDGLITLSWQRELNPSASQHMLCKQDSCVHAIPCWGAACCMSTLQSTTREASS